MAWKDVKLGGKFSVGFGVVIILLIVVGAWSVFGVRDIVDNASEVIDGNELRGNITQREVDHLNWTIDLNKLLNDSEIHELQVETDPTQCAFGQWYYSDKRREAEQMIPELRPLLEDIEDPHTHLHESAVDVGEKYAEVDRELGNFMREKKVDHLAWAHRVKDVFVDPDMNSFTDVELDHTQCSLGQYLYSDEVEAMRAEDPEFDEAIEPVYDPHRELHESAVVIAENLEEGRKDAMRSYYMNNTKPLAYETLDGIDSLLSWHDGKLEGLDEANRIYAVETSAALSDVQSLLQQIVHTTAENVMTDAAMLDAAQNTQTAVVIISIVSVILGILFAFIIALGIIKPIMNGVSFAREVAKGDLDASINIEQKDEIGQLANALNEMVDAMRQKADVAEKIADGDLTEDIRLASEKDGLGKSLDKMNRSLNELLSQVSEAVEQVTSGSDQVSQASQSLSQGATEQASSLEEISSSINQINSQSKQNAENAMEANGLSKTARENAEAGNSKMHELNTYMEDINASSDEINKVVKVIDDISFQINLLALNANVEAARAGKYGKGFAVVADEVRNLANRSGDSVTETTRMVEESIESIKKGTSAAQETGEQLQQIVEGINKVSDFLEEISQANRDQSQAIDQISEGLDQIDQVTQANTASAEESASAAEELAGQAQQLKGMIARFRLKNSGKSAGYGESGYEDNPEERGITPVHNENET
ncbi:MAG: methyl-accepting chemotaxis protein [Spirochaetia bacterium]